MAKTLGWGNSSVEERAVCQFLGVGGWAVPAPRGRGMFVYHYTIYFILWHDFSYRTRRQLMSTSNGTRERVVEGWRGGIRTGQRAQWPTFAKKRQQLRHRHRHRPGHRHCHRNRHRHRSVIVAAVVVVVVVDVSCFVFVFVSKTKAARKCSTRIVAWLPPQSEVCLIMHISRLLAPAFLGSPYSAWPRLGWAGHIPPRAAHKQVFRGMGESLCVCVRVCVCVCV